MGLPAGLTGSGGQLDLSALANNPQIQQLRELMAQNPAMAQHLIQQLAASSPQLAQSLASNPEAFAQLLGLDGIDFEGGDDGLPPGAQVVHITEEEQAAIQRVSSGPSR